MLRLQGLFGLGLEPHANHKFIAMLKGYLRPLREEDVPGKKRARNRDLFWGVVDPEMNISKVNSCNTWVLNVNFRAPPKVQYWTFGFPNNDMRKYA